MLSIGGLKSIAGVLTSSGGLTIGPSLTLSGGLLGSFTLSANVDANFFYLSATPVRITSAGTGIFLDSASGQNGITFANAGARLKLSNGGTTDYFTSDGSTTLLTAGAFSIGTSLTFASFTDDSATTGSRTVNTVRGFNAFAAAATAITITNSFVTTSSQIVATIMTNDATARLANVVPAAGSFTINLTAAATGITKVAWTVLK